MKKKMIWIAALAMGLLLAGCTAPSAPQASASAPAAPSAPAAVSSPEAPNSQVAPAAAPSDNVSAGIAGNGGSDEYISGDEAKAIALEHAGLAEADVEFVRIRLDYDDRRAEYDVEFFRGNEEYDYEIDAVSGEIVAYDYDVENYNRTASGAAGNAGASANGPALTADEAQNIALEHAGVDQANVRRMQVEYDRDDGRRIYEVEWDADGMEYSYEVDADTGDILQYESDWND